MPASGGENVKGGGTAPEGGSLLSSGSDLDLAQLDTLELSTHVQGTKQSTKWGVKKFTTWCGKRNVDINFSSISPEELAENLQKYYAEVKGEDGKALSPSGLCGLRSSLHRHITTPPVSRSINIIQVKFRIHKKKHLIIIHDHIHHYDIFLFRTENS